MPTFASLGVSADLADALTARGITEAFPIPALTIPDALAGRDVCGKAKTGSGKTFAFGLPVLARQRKAEPRHPTALALVPTRELAIQVRDELAPIAEGRGLTVVAVTQDMNLASLYCDRIALLRDLAEVLDPRDFVRVGPPEEERGQW